jgi:hypothetical protein
MWIDQTVLGVLWPHLTLYDICDHGLMSLDLSGSIWTDVVDLHDIFRVELYGVIH